MFMFILRIERTEEPRICDIHAIPLKEYQCKVSSCDYCSGDGILFDVSGGSVGDSWEDRCGCGVDRCGVFGTGGSSSTCGGRFSDGCGASVTGAKL
ncbi:Hypothetical predicted protein [Octopus vulgaris]|uniref:Uncharacterized protein n=1 Tax=Octopus vulgaris TaxID=6645 RepID=A0AA36F6W0_OCTVU|nr:Hypothetical predicted protein [Octopus vulgaris]